jgi:hypothetical protein
MPAPSTWRASGKLGRSTWSKKPVKGFCIENGFRFPHRSMAKPTPKERVEHVLEAIELIRTFVDNVDENSFVNDPKIRSAVQFQFLVI